MTTTQRIEQKEPFTQVEESYIYRTADYVTDGKGFKNKRTGQQNAIEDRIFAWTLRHTGLRLSDAVQLSTDNLVDFPVGDYTHAIHCQPKKTTDKDANFVSIPIPNEKFAADGFPDLVLALDSLPLRNGKYFFLGGGPLPPEDTPEWDTRIKEATTRWAKRMNRLFKIAAQLMEKDSLRFSHKPHPHRFRHTFA